MRAHQCLLSLAIAALAPLPSLACLWDYDTLEQEQSRFPTAIELITGKFLRHSKEFYEWRIKDRTQRLSSDPHNLAFYDDLAVAYQKVGQHDKAVQTMITKDRIKPTMYETEANLGTFYVLHGDLDSGLPYLDKALEINPHAHFDRERYQKWLVEYAISHRKNNKLNFPLREFAAEGVYHGDGTFDRFIGKKIHGDSSGLSFEEAQNAVKAVLGMMRFANHDNPLLLEALGDLLSSSDKDANLLATRAYLAASYKFKGKPEEQKYRLIAKNTLSNHENAQLPVLEKEFQAELLNAQTWYNELHSKEIEWIQGGLNADAEFDKLYAKDPVLLPPKVSQQEAEWKSNITIGSALGLLVLAFFMWRHTAASRKAKNQIEPELASNQSVVDSPDPGLEA